jgi:hypothetical protein
MTDESTTPFRTRPRIDHFAPAPEGALAEDIRASATASHSKAIEQRTAARRDAVVTVARARERRGAPATAWTAFDSDAVFLFADLLVKLQGGKEEPLDPAFAIRDAELARGAALMARVEEALKKDEP